MKIVRKSIIALILSSTVLLGVGPVQFTELIKANHVGESLEIESLLGEKEIFEDGKQYKITGSYKMLPRVIEGIKPPTTSYRIAVVGVNRKGKHSLSSEHLGGMRTNDSEGNFDIRFRYEDSDYLIITMYATSAMASGGILITDTEKFRKTKREVREHSQMLLGLLVN